MSSPSSSSKKIILKSSDGEIFEIEQSVASQFKLIKLMIEDDCADSAIPLPNVTGKILSKVIEFCKERDHSTNWDDNFLKVDQSTLFELILAANYLDIKSLMDLTCKTVADMMRGKNAGQLRNTFNIETDLTVWEEEAIRKENEWAFK